MSKKILVLSGNPNRGGNSTRMANAFVRAAQQADHSVTKLETAFKNMRGYSSQPDDFSELRSLLNKCDVLATSTPFY